VVIPRRARSGRRGRSGTSRSGGLTPPQPADMFVGRLGNRSDPVQPGFPPRPRRLRHRPARTGVPAQGALLDNGTEEGQSECGRPRPGPRVGIRALLKSIPHQVRTTSTPRPSWCQSGGGDAIRLSRSNRTVPSGGSGRHDLDGEFDPGSGRTLAACLIHASRAGLPPVATLVVAERRTGE
jgi:hypothetical protein